MVERCANPSHVAYRLYGGNGVTVTSRWLGEQGFINFLADMGERPNGTTLGRFGDVGNYELNNVKWMTKKEQGAERRKKGGGMNRVANHVRWHASRGLVNNNCELCAAA